MRLNLNDNIKVKLTEHGKDIYYHQYDRTNAFLGRELCKPSYPKVDEDGYTTFQLWCFMELYGVHMGMTLPNVIEPLDIVFDEPTIEERKTGKWYKPVGMMPPEYTGVYRCSKCDEIALCDWKHHKQVLSNFCPNCGKDMRTKETDYDYERAVEQLEHDMLYEPTFNQDDGSM